MDTDETRIQKTRCLFSAFVRGGVAVCGNLSGCSPDSQPFPIRVSSVLIRGWNPLFCLVVGREQQDYIVVILKEKIISRNASGI
jgi:hypothetical protein